MSQSIATLGIEIRSNGVQQAERDLDKLAQTGAKTEQQAQRLGESFRKLKPDSSAIREQKRALSELLGEIDPTVKALGRLDEQERKLAAFRKQGLIDSDTFRDYSTKITATRNALSGFEGSANKAGLSAKQLSAAMRGVPAQFTDIATALASGQRPLQVFLQQGGQLKDMFGGIGPAAKALGGYLLGLINPLTVSAAAAGALFLAWKQGSDEAVAFNRALILSGNTAGTTADAMQGMAVAISQGIGTQHEAADALAKVAESGKFTSEQLRDIADAAVAMKEATGQSIDDTVRQFARLGEDPVQAIIALNNQYHFLTESTYNQIKALHDQGRAEDAATLAARIASGELKKRATEVVENAGYMERAWRALGSVVRQVWDDIRNAGRASTAVSQAQLSIASAQSQLRANARLLREHGAGYSQQDIARFNQQTERFKAQIKAAQAAIANDPGVRAAQQQATNQRIQDAAIQYQQLADSYRSNEQKLTADRVRIAADSARQIATARANGNAAEAASIEKSSKAVLAALDKQIAEEKKRGAASSGGGRKPRSGASTPADDGLSLLASIRQQIAANNAAAESEDKLSASESLHVRVIEQLKDSRLHTTFATREAIDAALKELDASDKAAKAAAAEAAAKKSLATITEELANAEETRRKANQADLLALAGRGREELAQAQRRLDIEREYNSEVKALHQRAASEHRGVLKEEEDALKDSLAKRLADEADYQQKRAVLLADWRNGARAAVADFESDSANIAQQTYNIVSDGINGLADAFTDLLTKGKADWKSYFDNIGREITAFVVKQQLSKLLKRFAPGLLGGDDNSASALGASAAKLAASAAPLMTAAAALSASAAALAAAGIGQAGAGQGGGYAGLFGSLLGSDSGAASSSGGGFWSSLLSLFSSGGRAIGGPVSAGHLYEVTERGLPEVYVAGGRQYLLAPQSGEVRPAMASRATGGTTVNQTIVVQGLMDSRTPSQLAQASMREQRRATSRN